MQHTSTLPFTKFIMTVISQSLEGKEKNMNKNISTITPHTTMGHHQHNSCHNEKIRTLVTIFISFPPSGHTLYQLLSILNSWHKSQMNRTNSSNIPVIYCKIVSYFWFLIHFLLKPLAISKMYLMVSTLITLIFQNYRM